MLRNTSILDLTDCGEFRQRLEGRTPAFVHGVLFLLTAMIIGAVAWASLTKANLVVVAQGRVRPVESPNKVFASISPKIEGRVVEVSCQEGDQVCQGDVLLRLDTEQLDNEIAKLQSTIGAGEEELEKLAELPQLLNQQFRAANAKAEAELAHALQEVRRAERRRQAEIAESNVELNAAENHLKRIRELRLHRAATETELVDATARVKKAEQRLVLAQLGVDDGKVEVLRRDLELVQRDFNYRREELTTRQVTRRGEVSSARKELCNWDLQRRQAEVRAPFNGVVIAGEVNENDILEPGKPVLEIARDGDLRFEATVASEDVGGLREGMPVRIKFDAFDFQKFGVLQGKVCFISPDSKVAAAGEGVHAPVYIVKIELAGDQVGRDALRGQIKLGMTGRAEIVTDRQNILGIFAKQIRRTISFD